MQNSDSDSDGDGDSGEDNSGHFMYKAYCKKSLQILQKGSKIILNPKSTGTNTQLALCGGSLWWYIVVVCVHMRQWL